MTRKSDNRKRKGIAGLTRVAAVLSLVPLSLLAQAPTFRTGTTLVEFTIVAVDGDGNPVTDLKPDEIVLTDRGRPREIAFFRFDGGPAPAIQAAAMAPPPGFVTNRPPLTAGPQHGVVAIVIDLINTAPNDQTSVRAQTLRYLETLPSNVHAGLFHFSEKAPMTTLQTFTDRVDLLRAQVASLEPAARQELAMQGHRGLPIVGGDCNVRGGGIPSAALGQITLDDTESPAAAARIAEERALSARNEQLRGMRLKKTLAGLEALGNHLSAMPGPKSLVWITSGMPILLSPIPDRQTFTSFEPQIRQSAQRLANQGVAVYPVDAKGGCRALDRSLNQGFDGTNDAPVRVFGSLELVADVTGGRFIKYTNDPTAGVTIAANDQRGTYTIGFYAADEADDNWRSLGVRVERRGVTVRHRQGYRALVRAAPESWTGDQWQALANEPLDAAALRLSARAEAAGDQVVVSLQIAAGDLYFREHEGRVVADLEIGVIEIGRDGPTNVRQQPMEISLRNPLKDQRSAVIPLKTTWPLGKDTSSIRVVARDRFTGRYGSVNVTLGR